MTSQVTKAGRGYDFSPSLKPLEKHRDDLTIFSVLHHPNGLGQAHVCADTWLTGAKIDAQSARQYHNTISCDQLMAEVTSRHTRFASLELSISAGTGQPNNSCTLAFSRDGVPLPAEDNPRNVFDCLFGEAPGGVAAQRARLDRVAACWMPCSAKRNRCARDSAPDDRSKLDEYLHSVRRRAAPLASIPGWMCRSQSGRQTFPANVSKAGRNISTMFDHRVACCTDMTRVVTYERQRGQRARHTEIGITQSRHNLSHHNGDAEVLGRSRKRRVPHAAFATSSASSRKGWRGKSRCSTARWFSSAAA